jgi:hypothetical protein
MSDQANTSDVRYARMYSIRSHQMSEQGAEELEKKLRQEIIPELKVLRRALSVQLDHQLFMHDKSGRAGYTFYWLIRIVSLQSFTAEGREAYMQALAAIDEDALTALEGHAVVIRSETLRDLSASADPA